jgi:hypothetical protein
MGKKEINGYWIVCTEDIIAPEHMHQYVDILEEI